MHDYTTTQTVLSADLSGHFYNPVPIKYCG